MPDIPTPRPLPQRRFICLATEQDRIEGAAQCAEVDLRIHYDPADLPLWPRKVRVKAHCNQVANSSHTAFFGHPAHSALGLSGFRKWSVGTKTWIDLTRHDSVYSGPDRPSGWIGNTPEHGWRFFRTPLPVRTYESL